MARARISEKAARPDVTDKDAHVHTENDFKAVQWNTNISILCEWCSLNFTHRQGYFSTRLTKKCSVCLCDSARLCKQQKSVLITTQPF